jgi:hypothetical protein
MSRKDSPRYPNMVRKVKRRRRFNDADEKQYLEETREPGESEVAHLSDEPPRESPDAATHMRSWLSAGF